MNKQCIISTILYTFVDDKERKDSNKFRFLVANLYVFVFV